MKASPPQTKHGLNTCLILWKTKIAGISPSFNRKYFFKGSIFNCYFSLPADFCWNILNPEFLLKHIQGGYISFQVHLVATGEGFGILPACRLQILPSRLNLQNTKLWKWTGKIPSGLYKNEAPFCGIRRLLKSHGIDTKQLAQGHKTGGNVPSTYCPSTQNHPTMIATASSKSNCLLQSLRRNHRPEIASCMRGLNRTYSWTLAAGNGRKSSIETLRFKVPMLVFLSVNTHPSRKIPLWNVKLKNNRDPGLNS